MSLTTYCLFCMTDFHLFVSMFLFLDLRFVLFLCLKPLFVFMCDKKLLNDVFTHGETQNVAGNLYLKGLQIHMPR